MNDINELTEAMAEAKSAVAAQVCDSTIGEHVLDIISSKKELSTTTLLESLRAAIDNSPSAQGKLDPAQDTDRIVAEKAIEAIIKRQPC